MLPPLHKVDGPIEYVLVEDDAWDRDRITAETAGMPEDEKGGYPWYEYYLGETRYDLKQVEHLFREGDRPVVFTFRRLDYLQWRQVEELSSSADRHANDLALAFGLVSVKNGDEVVVLKGPDSDAKRLTDGDFRKLVELFGYRRVQDVGRACRVASGDLTVREKKA